MRRELREHVFRKLPTEEELAKTEVEDVLDLSPDERLELGLSAIDELSEFAGPRERIEAALDEDPDEEGPSRDRRFEFGGRRRTAGTTAQEDHAEMLSVFNRHGVRYVVVRGIAVIRLVPYRTTYDLDVLVEATLKNATSIYDALTEFFGTPPSTSPSDMLGIEAIRYGGPTGVDVHMWVDGATWAEVAAHAEPADFRGVSAPFADLDRLIVMKEAAGRPRDRRDLVRLRKLKERNPVPSRRKPR